MTFDRQWTQGSVSEILVSIERCGWLGMSELDYICNKRIKNDGILYQEGKIYPGHVVGYFLYDACRICGSQLFWLSKKIDKGCRDRCNLATRARIYDFPKCCHDIFRIVLVLLYVIQNGLQVSRRL